MAWNPFPWKNKNEGLTPLDKQNLNAAEEALHGDTVAEIREDAMYDVFAPPATEVAATAVEDTIAIGTANHKIQFANGSAGFFGVTPVTRPVVNKGSSTDELNTALKSLGLIAGT